MDKFLPGFHLLSPKIRRKVGWSAIVVALLIVVLPMIVFASTGPACGGGYPEKWCKAKLDTIVDNWGMYNRECVGYTAYRVAASGRTMPYGFGDANKWPVAAHAHGIPVDDKPRAGDVAVRFEGKHGHSMYVESINSDGTLNVSQYNTHKTGTYSEARVSPYGLAFIHF